MGIGRAQPRERSALETLAPYPVTAPLEAEHLDLRGAPSPTPPRRLRH